MLRRRQVKTHGRLMREELNEGLGHFRIAAGHAAGGAAGVLAPRLEDARKAASNGVDSMLGAARDRARQANVLAHRGRATMRNRMMMRRKPATRRRWPAMIGGLMVAGAAAGAAGAMFSRRRTQQKWDEYGTTGSTTGLTDDARSMVDSAKSAMEGARERAAEKLSGGAETVQTPTISEGTAATRAAGRESANTLGQFGGQPSGTVPPNARP